MDSFEDLEIVDTIEGPGKYYVGPSSSVSLYCFLLIEFLFSICCFNFLLFKISNIITDLLIFYSNRPDRFSLQLFSVVGMCNR